MRWIYAHWPVWVVQGFSELRKSFSEKRKDSANWNTKVRGRAKKVEVE